ncbi:unnamed protein product, partial [Sphenostylis stenocarpa]
VVRFIPNPPVLVEGIKQKIKQNLRESSALNRSIHKYACSNLIIKNSTSQMDTSTDIEEDLLLLLCKANE